MYLFCQGKLNILWGRPHHRSYSGHFIYFIIIPWGPCRHGSSYYIDVAESPSLTFPTSIINFLHQFIPITMKNIGSNCSAFTFLALCHVSPWTNWIKTTSTCVTVLGHVINTSMMSPLVPTTMMIQPIRIISARTATSVSNCSGWVNLSPTYPSFLVDNECWGVCFEWGRRRWRT